MKSKKVILDALPAGFVNDLPHQDQKALLERVGKAVILSGYDDDGRAELEFKDREGIFHTICVDPRFVRQT